MSSELLPDWEHWYAWPSLVTIAGTMGAVMIGFIPRTAFRVVSLGILGVVIAYGVALTASIQAKPERDYAYLFVHPARDALLPNGNVELFRRSTGILENVQICFAPTADYAKATSYDCFVNAENGKFHTFDESAGPFANIPPGDWTFDVDPLTKMGKVLERLNVVRDNGRAVVVFVQVKRKMTQEVLCETPPRDGIKPCL